MSKSIISHDLEILPQNFLLTFEHINPKDGVRTYGPEDGKYPYHACIEMRSRCNEGELHSHAWFKGHGWTATDALDKAWTAMEEWDRTIQK